MFLGVVHFVVFQSLCHVWLCDIMDCSTPGFSILFYLQELAQTHIHWVGDAIQPSHPLSPLLFQASVFPSIRAFSRGSVLCIRWPKYWSFSFNISPSTEFSGLISFRIDWFHLLVVQGTLKSLLQYHSSKASILQCSALFIVQLSYPYMTTGKTIALTRWTFVSKVVSLLFNTMCTFVIVFSKKHASFNFMAVVTVCRFWNWKKIKPVTVSIVSPSTCHEVMGPESMIFVFWMLSFKPAFSLSSHLHKAAL